MKITLLFSILITLILNYTNNFSIVDDTPCYCALSIARTGQPGVYCQTQIVPSNLCKGNLAYPNEISNSLAAKMFNSELCDEIQTGVHYFVHNWGKVPDMKLINRNKQEVSTNIDQMEKNIEKRLALYEASGSAPIKPDNICRVR